MRALLTGIVATIEAVAVALASLLVVACVAFLVWWLAFGLAAEPVDVFAGAAAAWLLAHFVPLSIELSPETMQLLGFAPEALRFALSLAPLGLTLVTVGFALRAGWRLASRGGAGAAGVLGGALGFAGVAAVLAGVAPLAGVGPALAALTGGLTYGVSAGAAYMVRAARDEHDWWMAALAATERAAARLRVPAPATLPYRAAEVLRLAAMLCAGYVGLAGVAFAAALLGRFAHVVGASEALQLDLWGSILMFVLQLALVPVLVVWSGAWLTGAGFAVGLGSSASPFGQLLAPLPGLPIFAAIPEGWGAGAVFAPVLVALVGVVVGALQGERARRRQLGAVTVTIVSAAMIAGLGVALLNWAATGALGPGRLAVVGPQTWVGAGLAAAELGVGCLLGVLAARADLLRRFGAGDRVTRVPEFGEPAASETIAVPAAPDENAVPAASKAAAGARGTDTTATEAETVELAPGLAPVLSLGDRIPERRAGFASGRGTASDDATARTNTTASTDADNADAEAQADAHAAANYVDADVDVDADAAETLPLVGLGREAELFDQHGHNDDDHSVAGATAGATADADADAGAAHDAPGETAPHGRRSRAKTAPNRPRAAADLDPDALVEAYSWDNAAAETEAPAAPKAASWRWPRRKG